MASLSSAVYRFTCAGLERLPRKSTTHTVIQHETEMWGQVIAERALYASLKKNVSKKPVLVPAVLGIVAAGFFPKCAGFLLVLGVGIGCIEYFRMVTSSDSRVVVSMRRIRASILEADLSERELLALPAQKFHQAADSIEYVENHPPIGDCPFETYSEIWEENIVEQTRTLLQEESEATQEIFEILAAEFDGTVGELREAARLV